VRLPVLTAADGAAWEAGLVTALERGEHGVSVVRRCVDVVDLLAVASAGQGRAALIAAGLRRLDADAVDRLHAAHVVPVGVVRRGDTAAEERLRATGIGFLVPEDADAGVVAAVIAEAVTAAAPGARAPRMFGDPSTSMAIPPGAGAPVAGDLPGRRGSVIAVWGPTGAPGRTTVAATLADEVARLGAPALLVDADVYGGTVAVLLGLLDESPGLAAACRQAGATRLDAGALADLCWQLTPTLRVLTGIPIAQRWPEVRASAIEAVLAATRALAEFTVLDCGFGLETDEELSFDSLAPRRNGATLAVLDHADVILAVGAADPIGLQRLVRGLAELRDAEVSAPIWVVLNKVRRGVVAGDPAVELTAALDRFAGRAPAALLPFDPDAVDAALAAGRSLGESRPASPLRLAVAELAAGLVGVPASVGRRRRRR
jgi:MinD-like ATPase involved in chromosome partitioning or flagellar assembly